MHLGLVREDFASAHAQALAGVWRADQLAADVAGVLGSGYPALDAQLPGGGWPVGALTELLQAQAGWGEWSLLLPALQALPTPRCVVLVGAPPLPGAAVPVAAALQARGLDVRRLLWVQADAPAARAWACEQALRCADVAAVLAWLPQARAEALRRLHLVAHDHAKLLWALRPAQAQQESSAASLRLLLQPAPAGSAATRGAGCVHILKRRGPPLLHPVILEWQAPALRALLGAAQAQTQTEPTAPVRTPVLGLVPTPRSEHALDRLATAA